MTRIRLEPEMIYDAYQKTPHQIIGKMKGRYCTLPKGTKPPKGFKRVDALLITRTLHQEVKKKGITQDEVIWAKAIASHIKTKKTRRFLAIREIISRCLNLIRFRGFVTSRSLSGKILDVDAPPGPKSPQRPIPVPTTVSTHTPPPPPLPSPSLAPMPPLPPPDLNEGQKLNPPTPMQAEFIEKMKKSQPAARTVRKPDKDLSEALKKNQSSKKVKLIQLKQETYDEFVTFIENARKVIQNQKLDRIVLPELKLDPKTHRVAFAIDHVILDETQTEEIARRLASDSEVREIYKTTLVQMVKFMLMTGYTNVNFSTVQFLADGTGLCLVHPIKKIEISNPYLIRGLFMDDAENRQRGLKGFTNDELFKACLDAGKDYVGEKNFHPEQFATP